MPVSSEQPVLLTEIYVRARHSPLRALRTDPRLPPPGSQTATTSSALPTTGPLLWPRGPSSYSSKPNPVIPASSRLPPECPVFWKRSTQTWTWLNTLCHSGLRSPVLRYPPGRSHPRSLHLFSSSCSPTRTQCGLVPDTQLEFKDVSTRTGDKDEGEPLWVRWMQPFLGTMISNHSCTKYWLSAYFVPGTIVSAENLKVNKFLIGLPFSVSAQYNWWLEGLCRKGKEGKDTGGARWEERVAVYVQCSGTVSVRVMFEERPAGGESVSLWVAEGGDPPREQLAVLSPEDKGSRSCGFLAPLFVCICSLTLPLHFSLMDFNKPRLIAATGASLFQNKCWCDSLDKQHD